MALSKSSLWAMDVPNRWAFDFAGTTAADLASKAPVGVKRKGEGCWPPIQPVAERDVNAAAWFQATARLPGCMAESDGSSIGEQGDGGEGR